MRSALVVEDDPVLLRAVSRYFEKTMRFEVLAAFDYRTAVRLLEKADPLIAYIDLCLPNESGYELCEYMRTRRALDWVPILVASEHGLPEVLAHAEEAGANAFLKKPFTMRQLGAYAEMLLTKPARSRAGMRLLRIA